MVKMKIDLTGLEAVIQEWFDKKQVLEPGYDVRGVDITVGPRSVPAITIRHDDGRMFSPSVTKKKAPDAKTSHSPERRIGLRRLHTINGLSTLIVNALGDVGISTVAGIRKMPLEKVLLIRNISKVRAQKIKEALAGIGEELDWDI